MNATAREDDVAWLAAYRAQIIEPHRVVFSLARGGLDDSSLVGFRRATMQTWPSIGRSATRRRRELRDAIRRELEEVEALRDSLAR